MSNLSGPASRTPSAPEGDSSARVGAAQASPSAMIGRLATKDKDAPKPKPNVSKQGSTFAIKTEEQIAHEEKVRHRLLVKSRG